MRKQSGHHFKLVLLVFCGILLGGLIGELSVRQLGSYDEDRNFFYKGQRIPPFRLPVNAVRAKIDAYYAGTPSSIVYDSVLGWTGNPGSTSENGLYTYNKDGIRSAFTTDTIHTNAVFRISLYGDSFTHADEVPFDESWGAILQRELNAAGFAVEVLNFGMRGYDMGQAYLRWQMKGAKYMPDLVIFGLQRENVARNLNVIRPVYYHRSGIPFGKPRFIFSGDSLAMLNVPTPPPDRIPDILENLDRWKYIEYENFFSSVEYQGNYKRNFLRMSKLVALVSHRIAPRKQDHLKHYAQTNEASQIALKIMRNFRKEVESTGAGFLVVSLPNKKELINTAFREATLTSYFMNQVRESFDVVQPEESFLDAIDSMGTDNVFMPGGHYSAQGNTIVAGTLSSYLRESVVLDSVY